MKGCSLDEVLVGRLRNVSSRLFAARWALIGWEQTCDLRLEHKHVSIKFGSARMQSLLRELERKTCV